MPPQELVALQRRAAGEGDDSNSGGGGPAAASPTGAGGAWATVGKRNKVSTMRGEEGAEVIVARVFKLCVVELVKRDNRRQAPQGFHDARGGARGETDHLQTFSKSMSESSTHVHARSGHVHCCPSHF
jgi:hypothetical protein